MLYNRMLLTLCALCLARCQVHHCPVWARMWECVCTFIHGGDSFLSAVTNTWLERLFTAPSMCQWFQKKGHRLTLDINVSASTLVWDLWNVWLSKYTKTRRCGRTQPHFNVKLGSAVCFCFHPVGQFPQKSSSNGFTILQWLRTRLPALHERAVKISTINVSSDAFHVRFLDRDHLVLGNERVVADSVKLWK